MKAVIFALFLNFVVATAVGKLCSSDRDCDDNECCIRKKGLSFFSKGDCKPLAKEDDLCMEDNELNKFFGKYCPCEKGLTCEPEKKKDSIFGNMKMEKRCVVPGGTEAPPEETEAPPEE